MKRRLAGVLIAGWVLGILGFTAVESRPLHGVLGWLGTTGPHMLAALLAVFGAWGVGDHLRARLLPDFAANDAAGRAVVSLGLGLAALQTVAVLLGSFGLLGVASARGLSAVAVIAGLLAWRGRTPSRGMPPAATLVFAIAVLGPSLILAGAPPIGPDEGQYHRRFVESILRTGAFPADAQDPLSGLAMGLHALLALPCSWTGIGAGRPFCLLIGLWGLVGGHRVARRLMPGTGLWMYAPVALAGATLLRALPTINTDLTLALFVGASALVVLDWRQAPNEPGGRPWVLAILGGAALSVKYTAPLFLAPLYLAVGASLLAQPPGAARGRAFGRLVLAALIPAAFAAPWLVRNALHMGHPLAPLAGFEPPPGLEAAFRFNFTENYGGGEGPGALLRSPIDLFVMGREFDRRHFLGRLNPWPLVALPGLLMAARKPGPARALIGVVFVGFLAWAVVLRRVIYLLPLWPLLAAATAVGLHELLVRAGRSKALMATSALLLGLVAAVEVAPAWTDALKASDVATGRETRAEYLADEAAHAEPLDFVRRHADPDDTVAMVWAWQAWDLPQRVIWIGAEEHTPFRQLVLEAGDADGFTERMHTEGVRWIVYRRARFPHQGYGSLDEATWTAAFQQPLAIVEEALARHTTERWIRGDYAVYELPEAR
jgi:hypothetical protein